jgi:hypothetical protein
MPRQDWNTPTRLDAYRALMGIPDDNSYYSACTGFKQSAGFGDIDDEFQQACVDAFGYAPIRIQNLTDDALTLHQSNGWSSAQRGVQCVLDQGSFVLNPKQTEFQKFCINNCIPVAVVQSGEWERAGQAVRDSYWKLWEKFQEMYPPEAPSP